MANAELITIAETAKRLGISTRTVERWIKQGRLKAIRLGPRLVRVKYIDPEQMGDPIPAVFTGGGYGY